MSLLKNTLGQVGDLGKQAGESLLHDLKKTTKAAVAQVGFERVETEHGLKQSEPPKEADKNNEDIVKSLYASSEKDSSVKQENPQLKASQEIAEKNPDKTPEEVTKIAALKQQLHTETYFDPTFNPARKQQEEQIEEQKKDQEEEQDKRWELQEKKEEQKEKDAILQQQKKSIEKRPGAG